MPPDDERKRRRLGDETKSRIADLASGWTVESPAVAPDSAAEPKTDPQTPSAATSTAANQDAPIPRPKQKTNPPPPPGSPERKALEDKIVATRGDRDDDSTSEVPPRKRATTGAHVVAREKTPTGQVETTRPKSPTGQVPASPPPVPPRAKGATGQVPISPPPPPRAKGATGQVPIAPPAPPRAKGATGQVPVSPAAPPRSKAITGQVAAGEVRPKPPTTPPPPPGSPERIIAERSKPASVAPPIENAPPSGPKYPRAGNDGPAPPFATEQRTFTSEPRTPPVIVDHSITEPSLPVKPATVPVGEFDSGARTLQQDTTAKRDAAEALLKIPDAETPVEALLDDDDDKPQRGDATTIDPQTAKFERGDPTNVAPPDGDNPDATQIESPRARHHTGGTLRRSAQLRRKRGLAGDVRYVFTAVFGVRRSRRELIKLEQRQELRQTSRRRHLVTLGRTAAVMDTFDHPALGKAREMLAAIEDERSQHAGAVAASDAELERVRRDRQTKLQQYAADVNATDAELAELAKKLEPLEKEAAGARRRAQELRDELLRIDRQITETERLLDSVKAEKMDKGAIHADIATYKANRIAVQRDEPTIAAQLDALNPRIAAMEATRAELQKKRAELDKNEQEDQRRTTELLEAIGAKRKVVERASADAEAARDNALFELGDRLYVDRPSALSAQLSPIDQIDLELGEGDRRLMELKEILSNIDRWKFARGLAMIILFVGAVTAFVVWMLTLLL